MNAIISNGDYTATVQLPVERKQLAGALSYLGKNHASAYDIKYNEESDQGLSFTLDCRGVVENAIAKAIPTGFRFHTFNDTTALMHSLPYQSKREFENTVKVEGLASYEQLDRMLSEAYPVIATTLNLLTSPAIILPMNYSGLIGGERDRNVLRHAPRSYRTL